MCGEGSAPGWAPARRGCGPRIPTCRSRAGASATSPTDGRVCQRPALDLLCGRCLHPRRPSLAWSRPGARLPLSALPGRAPGSSSSRSARAVLSLGSRQEGGGPHPPPGPPRDLPAGLPLTSPGEDPTAEHGELRTKPARRSWRACGPGAPAPPHRPERDSWAGVGAADLPGCSPCGGSRPRPWWKRPAPLARVPGRAGWTFFSLPFFSTNEPPAPRNQRVNLRFVSPFPAPAPSPPVQTSNRSPARCQPPQCQAISMLIGPGDRWPPRRLN